MTKKNDKKRQDKTRRRNSKATASITIACIYYITTVERATPCGKQSLFGTPCLIRHARGAGAGAGGLYQLPETNLASWTRFPSVLVTLIIPATNTPPFACSDTDAAQLTKQPRLYDTSHESARPFPAAHAIPGARKKKKKKESRRNEQRKKKKQPIKHKTKVSGTTSMYYTPSPFPLFLPESSSRHFDRLTSAVPSQVLSDHRFRSDGRPRASCDFMPTWSSTSLS